MSDPTLSNAAPTGVATLDVLPEHATPLTLDTLRAYRLDSRGVPAAQPQMFTFAGAGLPSSTLRLWRLRDTTRGWHWRLRIDHHITELPRFVAAVAGAGDPALIRLQAWLFPHGRAPRDGGSHLIDLGNLSTDPADLATTTLRGHERLDGTLRAETDPSLLGIGAMLVLPPGSSLAGESDRDPFDIARSPNLQLLAQLIEPHYRP